MSLLNKFINDDFIFDAIKSQVAGKSRRTASGFYQFDCPSCTRRGESQDHRRRCGVIHTSDGVGVHCFNCGLKTRWKLGTTLSQNFRNFMLDLGISEKTVNELDYKAATYRRFFTLDEPIIQKNIDEFKTVSLPQGCKTIQQWVNDNCEDKDFYDALEYLYDRGNEIAESISYYWTPIPGKYNYNRRIIVPFIHDGEIVGYTGRAIDKISPKYSNNSPPDFLFNIKSLEIPSRKYGVLVEGIFDAIAIDGVGLCGSHLNQKQITWINNFEKEIILVPDRDKKGSSLIDIAIQQEWKVAFPVLPTVAWWEEDVKDAAEATKRYGKTWTLLSIIESATNNIAMIKQYKEIYF